MDTLPNCIVTLIIIQIPQLIMTCKKYLQIFNRTDVLELISKMPNPIYRLVYYLNTHWSRGNFDYVYKKVISNIQDYLKISNDRIYITALINEYININDHMLAINNNITLLVDDICTSATVFDDIGILKRNSFLTSCEYLTLAYERNSENCIKYLEQKCAYNVVKSSQFFCKYFKEEHIYYCYDYIDYKNCDIYLIGFARKNRLDLIKKHAMYLRDRIILRILQENKNCQIMTFMLNRVRDLHFAKPIIERIINDKVYCLHCLEMFKKFYRLNYLSNN